MRGSRPCGPGRRCSPAAIAAEGSSVTVRIKERERVLPALRAESVVHAGAWTTTWYLAMICRGNELLTTLAQTPVPLLRDSGALFDGYALRWVETPRSYWLGLQDVGGKLVAAVDAAGPRAVRPADAELASRIVRPSMLLPYRGIRRDPAEFDEALSDALLRHKEYWTRTRTVS